MAITFTYDGFQYEVLEDKRNEVALIDASNATGKITIPSEVEYNSTKFKVTKISGKYVGYSYHPYGDKRKKVEYGREFRGVFHGKRKAVDCWYGGWSAGASNIEVTIPNSVTSIDAAAFRDCTGLTSITIPNSVTSIDAAAFSGCTGLTSITIPNSITSIGERAFYECKSLRFITIPNSITSIGSNAFYSCSELTSITIPDSVTSIGYNAFYECKSLRFITIPKSVTSIGGKAFYSCSNLMSITVLPEDVMIGNEVFYGTQWWKNQPDGFVYLGKILLGYKGRTSDVQSAVDVKEGTTSIATYAFDYCNMPAVNLPKSLKCIGGNAFRDCEKLTSISIPSSITRIGDNIFLTECRTSNLQTLILTVDSIEEYCKSGINEQLEKSYTGSRILKIKDEEVTEVVIPDTVTSILPYAFARIPSITSVKIPDSVTNIGERAFYQSTKLEILTLPSGIITISKEAFYDCSGLTSITIPNSVTTIEDSAFKNCKALTSITIPDSVTTIGAYALKDCDTLTSITIPYSVTTIGKGALGGCDKLDTIIIENTPENITFDFANNSDDNWICKVQFVGQPENVEQLKAAAAARVASVPQKAAPKETATPAETPTAEPAPAPATPVAAQPAETPKPAAPTINLETLIAAALVDSIVTDKERAILCKKVKEVGGDVDEFEMLLDARIYEAHQKNQPAPAPKAEPCKADMEGMINESPETNPTANRVTHGAWTLELAENKSVKIYKNGELCEKTSPALRELAAEVGFTYDPGWNTRQFGSKLFAHLIKLS